MLDLFKEQIMSLYEQYKSLTASNTPNTPPPAAPVRNISAPVGKGGANLPDDVRLVQELLNKHGAKLVVDGAYGKNTLAAIVAFQRDKAGFPQPDGLISPGKKTWQALTGGSVTPTPNPNNGGGGNVTPNPNPNNNTTPPKGSNVSPTRGAEIADKTSDKTSPLSSSVGEGCTNNAADVKLIQELLGLPQTGKVDAALTEAIKKFQSTIGLTADGKIDAIGHTMRYLSAYQKALNDIPDVPEATAVKILHPIPGGRPTSPFGKRFGRMHKGVDLAKGGGAAVLAIADGVASVKSQFGEGGGGGNYVVIDHGGGYQSLYMHLASASATGFVTAGQKIGVEGGTGYTGGKLYPIHLHFEVRINGTPVDPWPFLSGAKKFPPTRKA